MKKVKSKRSPDSSANLGFVAKQGLTAEKPNKTMDAAEYKGMVMVLIFSTYLSNPACGSGGLSLRSESLVKVHGAISKGEVGIRRSRCRSEHPASFRNPPLDMFTSPHRASTFNRDVYPDIRADYSRSGRMTVSQGRIGNSSARPLSSLKLTTIKLP